MIPVLAKVSPRSRLIKAGAESKQFVPLLPRYRRFKTSASTTELNEVQPRLPEQDNLDLYLCEVARTVHKLQFVSISDLYQQYLDEAGSVARLIVPYEERPSSSRRAGLRSSVSANPEGDGTVLVVNAVFDVSASRLLKTTVCSGFVVNASVENNQQGDIVVTCAHTLEEMQRHLDRNNHKADGRVTFSFVLPAKGEARIVTRLLSSMPRSDVIVLEAHAMTSSPRLTSLPLNPYPIIPGMPILTHLFGSPEPPPIQHSVARTQALQVLRRTGIEDSIPWVNGHAWRRWGSGIMLGYRSYTGLELEAGISSVLPHILTSILPTPGSSGGPLVHAEMGSVVGMTSGRRMDNYIEGERGWGCSAESIFEMFSLPGFMPSNQYKKVYP